MEEASDHGGEVRLAVPADICRLAEIHLAAWRAAYRGILSDHELFAVRKVDKGMVMFARILDEGIEEVLVHEAAGILRGLAIHLPSRDQDRPGDREVKALYVEPAFQGSGSGTRLIRAVEARARDAGCTGIRIWTLEQNSQARGFYGAMGYTADGARKYLESFGAWELRYGKEYNV